MNDASIKYYITGPLTGYLLFGNNWIPFFFLFLRALEYSEKQLKEEKIYPTDTHLYR